jgi:hypothetical protein
MIIDPFILGPHWIRLALMLIQSRTLALLRVAMARGRCTFTATKHTALAMIACAQPVQKIDFCSHNILNQEALHLLLGSPN